MAEFLYFLFYCYMGYLAIMFLKGLVGGVSNSSSSGTYSPTTGNTSTTPTLGVEVKDGAYLPYFSGKLPTFSGDTVLKMTAWDLYHDTKNITSSSEKNPMPLRSTINEANRNGEYWGAQDPLSEKYSGGTTKGRWEFVPFIPASIPVLYSGNRTILFELTYSQNGKWYVVTSKKMSINMPLGLKDIEENAEKTREIFLKIGVAVAFADGTADKDEKAVIKTYATKLANDEDEIKEKLNKIMKSALRKYKDYDSSQLKQEIAELTEEYDAIAIEAQKYILADFCYDIMAADKEAHPNELLLLKEIKKQLSIDDKYFENLADKKLVNIDSSSIESSREEMLGIDPKWSNKKKREHLTSEFKKWNSRLNTFEEGDKRKKAQEMLDLIGKALKDYES